MTAWRIALDRDEIVGTVLIDLSKAFDSIDYDMLLTELEAYGVRGIEKSWFVNYLSGRRQRVVVNGAMSNWSKMVKGVPQGSILGPLLFMIFTNDMPPAVKHCSVNLYADDTTIYCSADDPLRVSHMLEVDLESVLQWIERNHLLMNVAKTQMMVLMQSKEKEAPGGAGPCRVMWSGDC